MFKRISEKRKAVVKIPALIDGEKVVVSDKEKAAVLGRAFVAVHSGGHLKDIQKQQIDLALRENKDVKLKKEDGISTLDSDFTMSEFNMALLGTGYTAPGQDQLCYAMFRQLPIESFKLVLRLFNKIWRDGIKLSHWKRAVILPFNKPGKDPTNPGNYRPIHLIQPAAILIRKRSCEG